jgi:hypothetical protein
VLSVYACVAGFGGLSILIGHLVWRLAGGGGWTWTAPAIGLGAAICVSEVAVRLPGHGWTVLAILVALAAAGAVTLWPEVRRRPRGLATGLCVATAVAAAVSLPFLLNGRLGLLGAHVLDDLGFHLAWAEALSTGHGGFALIDRIQPNYPVGPHTLVAGLARPFGVLPAFTGFLMVVPVLTALTALGALRAVPAGWRVLGAVLTGLPYLAVSYFAEGSFKEPTAALLVLGFVLVLLELPARPRPRAALAPAVLALACVLTFGLRGLVWPAAALAAWAVVAAAPRRRELLPRVRRLAPGIAVLAGAVVLASALGASLGSVVTDIASYRDTSAAGGNFIRTVSPLVGLGGWPVPDFRLSPESTAKVVLATAVVVVALAYALALSARRRDGRLFAATGATVVVYIVAAAVSSSYLSLKALVVVAPLLTLSIARALFLLDSRRRWAQLVTALAFAAVVAWSSTTALRGASVSAPAHADQLRAQRSLLRHGPTLVLFDDHYVRWELLGVRLGNPLPYGFAPDVPVTLRPRKSTSTFDFDSVPSGVLDRFRYVVTVRGPYASAPPANWHLRRRLASFDVWERGGPTAAREVLDEQDRPGTVLACADRRRRPHGVAAVRAFPVLGPVAGWRIPGAAPPSGGAGPAPLPPGREMSQGLDLPRGRWSISLRYSSAVPLSLRAGGRRVRLPAITEPPTQFRFAGTIDSLGGRVLVSVRAERGSRWLIARDAEIDAVAATPAPWSGRAVSLARACGSYVDWFAR